MKETEETQKAKKFCREEALHRLKEMASKETLDIPHIVELGKENQELLEQQRVQIRRAVCCKAFMLVLHADPDLNWILDDGEIKHLTSWLHYLPELKVNKRRFAEAVNKDRSVFAILELIKDIAREDDIPKNKRIFSIEDSYLQFNSKNPKLDDSDTFESSMISGLESSMISGFDQSLSSIATPSPKKKKKKKKKKKGGKKKGTKKPRSLSPDTRPTRSPHSANDDTNTPLKRRRSYSPTKKHPGHSRASFAVFNEDIFNSNRDMFTMSNKGETELKNHYMDFFKDNLDHFNAIPTECKRFKKTLRKLKKEEWARLRSIGKEIFEMEKFLIRAELTMKNNIELTDLGQSMEEKIKKVDKILAKYADGVWSLCDDFSSYLAAGIGMAFDRDFHHQRGMAALVNTVEWFEVSSEEESRLASSTTKRTFTTQLQFTDVLVPTLQKLFDNFMAQRAHDWQQIHEKEVSWLLETNESL